MLIDGWAELQVVVSDASYRGPIGVDLEVTEFRAPSSDSTVG